MVLDSSTVPLRLLRTLTNSAGNENEAGRIESHAVQIHVEISTSPCFSLTFPSDRSLSLHLTVYTTSHHLHGVFINARYDGCGDSGGFPL